MAGNLGDLDAGLGWRKKVLVGVLFFGWLAVFTAGVTIDSSPYREQLADPFSLGLLDFLKAFFLTLTCYTLTNIAILVSFAALLGPLGRRARLGVSTTQEPDMDLQDPYFSAVIRGFFVYLVLLSGTIVLGSDAISNPGPIPYIRTAGVFSLFSFLVNYNPHLFSKVLSRAARLLADSIKDDEKDGTERNDGHRQGS